MIAIKTKYLPATDTKGARIKASAYGVSQSVTMALDYSLDINQNHDIAAKKLAALHYGGFVNLASGWLSVDCRAHVPVLVGGVA